MYRKTFNKVPECYTVPLIKQIEKYPVIWDTCATTSDIRMDRTQAYELIAEYINSLSAVSIKLTADSIQDKWRNIRVAYRNSYYKMLATLNGDKSTEHIEAQLNEIHDSSKYKYKHELYFLAKQMVARDSNTIFDKDVKDGIISRFDMELDTDSTSDVLMLKDGSNSSIFPEIKEEILDLDDIISEENLEKSLHPYQLPTLYKSQAPASGVESNLNSLQGQQLSTPPLTRSLLTPPFPGQLTSTPKLPPASTCPTSTSYTTSISSIVDPLCQLSEIGGHSSVKKRRHNGHTASKHIDTRQTMAACHQNSNAHNRSANNPVEELVVELSDSIMDINSNITALMTQQRVDRRRQILRGRHSSSDAPSFPTSLHSNPNSTSTAATCDSKEERRVSSFFSYVSNSVNSFEDIGERNCFMDDVYSLLRKREITLGTGNKNNSADTAIHKDALYAVSATSNAPNSTNTRSRTITPQTREKNNNNVEQIGSS